MTSAQKPAGFPRATHGPKPVWLRKPLVCTGGAVCRAVGELGLHTVCEEARCPNRHECWDLGRAATFLVLGNRCTRNCRFCSVQPGRPEPPDSEEPHRVAEAVARLNLRYAVITMTTRDDLPDGGAAHLAATVAAIRRRMPACTVEVLSSDLGGDPAALDTVLSSSPAVFGHNIETVRRLSSIIRPAADYERSLRVLRWAHERRGGPATKSALLVGLGETWNEILETMDDLRAAGVDLLAIGQYLQPTRNQLPVERYWTPEEFERMRHEALRRGFVACEAGPWVRSSYRADRLYDAWLAARGPRD